MPLTMMRHISMPLLALLLLMAPARAEEVVFENARFRAVLGNDAAWRSLVEKHSGNDYAAADRKVRFAAARIAGTWRQAASARLDDGRLIVGFAGVDTQLVYAVETRPDWVVFRLQAVRGVRPTDLILVRIGVTLTEHVGPRLGGAWSNSSAVCLMATHLGTQGSARRHDGCAELACTTQDAPGPRLEAAGAALVAAPTPALDGILARLATACGLPRNEGDGVPSKHLPLARGSYWFLTFGEADVDKIVDLCRRSGLRQVMMNSGSWCRTVGHYTFHTSRYPDGLESLRRTVARLHEAGILVGMHGFASKISKTDAYVTPVPDRRFWVDRTAVLADDVDAHATAIRTETDLRQWPGSPVATQKTWEGGVAKHQETVIDDEIIRYESIGPEGKWNTFLGCQRGAWGTRPAPHNVGTPCRHYGVDGCINGYIVDQETTLLDETTTRLAHIFNTCGFDMVYFDGGEDVDRRRFTHYVSKFQATAMGKFAKRPLIHMGTIMTHNLWHSFTRSGTVDTYPNTIRGRLIAGGTWDTLPTVKEHVDRSVAYMLSVRDDRMPGELGWFGIWPRSKDFEGLQLDEIEYLMGKSLAYDAPVSLQTSFGQMDAHPLTPGLLEIVRAYETLRAEGTVDEATRARLREKGADFVLLRREPDAKPEFVRADPLEKVGGKEDLRACVGNVDGGAVATLWHAIGKKGTLLVAADPADVRATDLAGQPVAIGRTEGRVAVPFGHRRTTVHFDGISAADVRKLLAGAKVEPRKPVCLWIQAEDFARAEGKMARGADATLEEPDAFGDVLVCTGRPNPAAPPPWYAEYAIDVPRDGRWTLWARVRYPTGADHSFGIVRPGETVTLSGAQVLGNCGVNGKAWHWTGRGSGSTAVPPGLPIAFDLPAGRFVFRIHAREGTGAAATNPRLDLLCLTDDPDYRPTDADARAGLSRGAPPK